MEAHVYDVAAPQLATCPARPGPDRAQQSPFETRPMLTVDQSTLTVDLAHMSVAQTHWTHTSDADVMLTT